MNTPHPAFRGQRPQAIDFKNLPKPYPPTKPAAPVPATGPEPTPKAPAATPPAAPKAN